MIGCESCKGEILYVVLIQCGPYLGCSTNTFFFSTVVSTCEDLSWVMTSMSWPRANWRTGLTQEHEHVS